MCKISWIGPRSWLKTAESGSSGGYTLEQPFYLISRFYKTRWDGISFGLLTIRRCKAVGLARPSSDCQPVAQHAYL